MITRKDIANRVGVSVSVVSRALNNSGYVNADKRQKIIEAAENMGYYPNPVAMSLQQSRTKQILFYSKDLDNHFNIEVYEGLLDEAERYGYVVLLNGRYDFRNIPSLMIDGVVLPNPFITRHYLQEIGRKYHLPAVTVSYGEAIQFDKAVPMVQTDLYEGVIKALNYLKKKGHHKIAFAAPYPLHSDHSRILAWKHWMMEEARHNPEKFYLGINKTDMPNDSRVRRFPEEECQDAINVWENYYDKGMLAADVFHEERCHATAVMFFNDQMALGFLVRIKALGYSIPQDLSIMGIDGLPSGQHSDIGLTTLEIQARKMGALCFRELLGIINDEKEHCITRVPVKIIEGRTVSPIG